MAHVVSHPIQYFAPLYQVIEERDQVDLEVFFYSDVTLGSYRDVGFGRAVKWDTNLTDGYRSNIPPGSVGRPELRDARKAVRPDLFRAVMSSKADVLWVHAYHWPTSLALAYAFLATNRPVVIRGEQTTLQRASTIRRRAKDLLMRPLVQRARCAFIGQRNREYLRRYGAKDSNLYFAPYSVPDPSTRPSREAAKAALGIDPALPVVLFVGKLVDRKQPLLLLDAWAQVSQEIRSCLLFAGDGPLRPAIEEKIEQHGLETIVLAGFLNQGEMPLAYAAADVFVLPSTGHEPWGLVVNEALMAGLPTIVSASVGSVSDLIVDDWNGSIVPPADAGALADRLARLLRDPGLRSLWGERGRMRAAEYAIDRTADGLIAAFLGDQSLAPTHRASWAPAAQPARQLIR